MTTVSMSVQDALWLTMDRPNNLMVVDGSMVLRGCRPSMTSPRSFRRPWSGSRSRPSCRAFRHGWAWEDDRTSTWRHIHEVELEPAPDRGVAAVHGRAAIAAAAQGPATLDQVPAEPAHPPGRFDRLAWMTRFHPRDRRWGRLTQVLLGLCEAGRGQYRSAVVARKGVQGGDSSSPADELTRVRTCRRRWRTWSSTGSAMSPTGRPCWRAIHCRRWRTSRAGLSAWRGRGCRGGLVTGPAPGPAARRPRGAPGRTAQKPERSVIGHQDHLRRLRRDGVEQPAGHGEGGGVVPAGVVGEIGTQGRRAGAGNDGHLRGYGSFLSEQASCAEVAWMVPVNLKPSRTTSRRTSKLLRSGVPAVPLDEPDRRRGSTDAPAHGSHQEQ